MVIPAPAETCPGFATWAKRMMTLQELWGSNPGTVTNFFSGKLAVGENYSS